MKARTSCRLQFWLPVLLLAACSDYKLGNGQDSPPPAGDSDANDQDSDSTDSDSPDSDTQDSDSPPDPNEEVCDGADNDADGEVDEGFDANSNGIADCLETTEYCTPFDDFSGWSYTGEGDWYVESGYLTEGRAGSYAGIAYTADMGLGTAFSIETGTAWTGNDNDLTGIAWAVNGENAYVARWDDPQGDYERYTPTGGMDISRCDSSGCTVLYADSSADLYWPADLTFAIFRVQVNGADVQVIVNGAVVLTANLPEIAGTGPGVVGVYSNDNDGGVWFDDFCVWSSG